MRDEGPSGPNMASDLWFREQVDMGHNRRCRTVGLTVNGADSTGKGFLSEVLLTAICLVVILQVTKSKGPEIGRAHV